MLCYFERCDRALQYCRRSLGILLFKVRALGVAIAGYAPLNAASAENSRTITLWSPMPNQCGKHTPWPVTTPLVPKIVEIWRFPLKWELGTGSPVASAIIHVMWKGGSLRRCARRPEYTSWLASIASMTCSPPRIHWLIRESRCSVNIVDGYLRSPRASK